MPAATAVYLNATLEIYRQLMDMNVEFGHRGLSYRLSPRLLRATP